MVVIPIFSGLLVGVLSLFWPSRLGILPRVLLAALSASMTAMLFGLVVYFSQPKVRVRKTIPCLGHILAKLRK